MNELDRIRESSQYLATLLRRPEMLEWLWDRKNIQRRYPLTGLYQDLTESIGNPGSFQELQLAIRTFKQRHFLRIAARDLIGWADLSETTSQVSDIACVTLQAGLTALMDHPDWWLGEDMAATWRDGSRDIRLVVVGLGKLGGNELNFVSDIDILFLHDLREDASKDAREALTVLSVLCQRLTRLMAENVAGDCVFRVDLRLRPSGKDGELAPSLAGATEHYLHHGHAWERQMLLKARPVAGERTLGAAFVSEVRPFVFRRFLDFQALDEIRDMRDRILKEAPPPRPGWEQFDVKLGMGGIREVEFVVQCLQLIYGGRRPELDEPGTLRCLDRLREARLLPEDAAAELAECYVFLRRVEHWIQLDQNRQTQKLPRTPEARRRLFNALGFGGDEAAFLGKLGAVTETVHRHFLALFQVEVREPAFALDEGGTSSDPSERFKAIEGAPPDAVDRLRGCLEAFPVFLQSEALDVLESFNAVEDPEALASAILRLERYFGQVRRRRGLVKAFADPAPWTKSLLRALAQTRLVADLLAHQPGLIEGLLQRAVLCPPPEEWAREARSILGKCEDYEEAVEWVRRLKNERMLQAALAMLNGEMKEAELETVLTALADFVIRETFARVAGKLGMPPELPLAVVALGKLGSREMGFLSDLDLVFVYQPLPGERPDQTPGAVVRLVQRLMHMLSTPLQEGPGYPVDARLRPTGSYGPLIVTRDAWLEYYSSEADIWEIQALTRMRCVAGPDGLCSWLEENARSICYRERDSSAVWGRICHLRRRMQKERSQETLDSLDIKLGVGGIVDMEFIVQGNLLVEGWRDAALQVPSIREALKGPLAGFSGVEASSLPVLRGAFETMRALEHRLRLCTNMTSSLLNAAQLKSLESLGLWPPHWGAGWAESLPDVMRLRRQVRTALCRWCPDL